MENTQKHIIEQKDLLETTIKKFESQTYFGSLKFPKLLESLYQEKRFEKREKEFFIIGILGIVLYNLFNIADYIMLPDIWQKSLFLRIIIVTPLMILGLFAQRINFFKKKIDFLLSILIIIVCCSIVIILLLSKHPNVLHYYSGIVLVVLCGNIVFRLNFKCALFSSFTICILYGITSPIIMKGHNDVIFNSNLVLISGTLLSLVGSYYLERDDRIKFLLNLKLENDSLMLKDINKLLSEKVKIDPLTKLYNREYFEIMFEKEWQSALRYKYHLGIIFLDIDNFKAYNDNYGHQAGDFVLKEVAKVLKENVKRAHEIASRYGGEEFVILLPHINIEGTIKLAEKIRQGIESLKLPHEYSDYKIVTVSLGACSIIPKEDVSKDDFLKAADGAMYLSKNSGKNRVTSCKLQGIS